VRILHTSDWHLGLQSGRFSRAEEHQLFFDWLNKTIVEERVDVLIVAGDVFDGMQPSNESLALYYRFLCSVGETGLRDVVIVGGNHDSPSQLDAPAPLLSELNVHVVGGYSREGDLERHLLPLRVRGQEEPVAVCLALPYVHEWRLGIRTTDDPELTRKEFTERFTKLYSEVADLAEQKYPGLPMIGTGHLTMGRTQEGDSPQQIHQVGNIDSLPQEILDARMKYVALGHIHRSFAVEPGRIVYSGTPVPVSLTERLSPRVVMMVDLKHEGSTEDAVTVARREVPVSRELVLIEGREEVVLAKIRALPTDSKLPPFLYLRLMMDEPRPELSTRIREAIETHPTHKRPLLVELRENLTGADAQQGPGDTVALEELSTLEVFAMLCRQQGFEPGDELLGAFNTISSLDHETLMEKIESIEKGVETGGGAA
jgi:exonuclease SbcD